MQAILEELPLTSRDAFACRDFVGRRFTAPWHAHPQYELTLIEEGSGFRLVGDSVERFESGDLVLVGGELPHCWTNPCASAEPRAFAIVAQFSLSFLGKDFLALPELLPLRTLLARAMRGLRFQGPVREMVRAQMHGLLRVRGDSRVVALLAILRVLAASEDTCPLSSSIYRPKELDPDDAHEAEDRMEVVCRFLLSEFTRELDVAEAASVAGMSHGAFRRAFRNATGKTLTHFVNELRIGHACRMLIDTDCDVSEASCASGYSNLSHFHRQFQRLVGCPPGAYRARHALAAAKVLVDPQSTTGKLVARNA